MLRKTGEENGRMGAGILSGNVKINIPSAASQILRTLTDAGYEAYVVGGCVRDSLIGRNPEDWDITTSARPKEVKALFPKTIDTGIKHGTVTVRKAGQNYEVTTYRIDGVYADHRHPDEVAFTRCLSDDLERRDFTINAMAYEETKGLIDFFGGQDDLAAGVIRAVGDPMKRFDEDALRMMRAVRFSAQLGFTIDEETRSAIRQLAPTLAAVSAERIRVELEKLLLSDHPEQLRELCELGLTAVFFPEFDAMKKTAQQNPHHRYDVGEHTIAALCACVPITAGWREDPGKFAESFGPDATYEREARILRLAVLLHDVAKPLTKTTDAEGIDHFKGHPEKGAKMAAEILGRWKEDNRTIARVRNLITCHDLRPEADAVTVRKTASRVGREDFPLLLDVMDADVHGQSTYMQQKKFDRLSRIRTEWARILRAGEALSLAELAVTGQDLIDAGMPPGPQIGDALRRMLTHVLKYPEHNTREYLLTKYRGRDV
jgi:tRNA nucleotidyltransferase (CCA-adding enzyme)